MKRKLIKQGGQAYTITLPISWIRANNLETGELIDLEERNHELIISTDFKNRDSSVQVDIRNLSRSASFHTVISKYIQGYTQITILHDDSVLVRAIGSELLGFAFEEYGPKKCVLKDISLVPDYDPSYVMRKSAFLLVNQAKTLVEIAKGESDFEKMRTEEKLLDSNLLYCLRYFTKYNVLDRAYAYFLICSTFELIGDSLSEIGEHVGNNVELSELIFKYVSLYADLLFKNKYSQLNDELRNFRNSIKKETFIDGLAYGLAEIMYNFVAYMNEELTKKD